jgi:hypothetical protein
MDASRESTNSFIKVSTKKREKFAIKTGCLQVIWWTTGRNNHVATWVNAYKDLSGRTPWRIDFDVIGLHFGGSAPGNGGTGSW